MARTQPNQVTREAARARLMASAARFETGSLLARHPTALIAAAAAAGFVLGVSPRARRVAMGLLRATRC